MCRIGFLASSQVLPSNKEDGNRAPDAASKDWRAKFDYGTVMRPFIRSLGSSGYVTISSASPLLNDHLLRSAGVEGAR